MNEPSVNLRIAQTARTPESQEFFAAEEQAVTEFCTLDNSTASSLEKPNKAVVPTLAKLLPGYVTQLHYAPQGKEYT